MVTDCPSVEAMSGEVKVMVIEDAATRKAFSLDSASGIKFPFGLCEVNDEVHFSDYLRHSIYKIDFSEQSVSLAIGIEDDPGQNDGPSESEKLCYPVSLAARGACLYIAEHAPIGNPRSHQNDLFLTRADSISVHVARNCRGNGIGVKAS